jgi:hypothetical protein
VLREERGDRLRWCVSGQTRKGGGRSRPILCDQTNTSKRCLMGLKRERGLFCLDMERREDEEGGERLYLYSRRGILATSIGHGWSARSGPGPGSGWMCPWRPRRVDDGTTSVDDRAWTWSWTWTRRGRESRHWWVPWDRGIFARATGMDGRMLVVSRISPPHREEGCVVAAGSAL